MTTKSKSKAPTAVIPVDACRAAFDLAAPAHQIPVERYKHRPDDYKFEYANTMLALWRDAWRAALATAPVGAGGTVSDREDFIARMKVAFGADETFELDSLGRFKKESWQDAYVGWTQHAVFAAQTAASPVSLQRWTFDGGMTATISPTGQWVRYDDIVAAGPSAQLTAGASTGDIEARRTAVARAICTACCENPDHQGDARGNKFRWQDYLQAADAAMRAEALPSPAPTAPAVGAPSKAPEYRVGWFWSSSTPGKQVRCLAEGAEIAQYEKRTDFIAWCDVDASAAPVEGALSKTEQYKQLAYDYAKAFAADAEADESYAASNAALARLSAFVDAGPVAGAANPTKALK